MKNGAIITCKKPKDEDDKMMGGKRRTEEKKKMRVSRTTEGSIWRKLKRC